MNNRQHILYADSLSKSYKQAHGDDLHILKDFSLEMFPEEIVALVGPSGAGKSTVADLVSRFYDVQSGVIEIDGKDIRDIDLRSLRGKMGIVTQETILFDDTIESNIAYGISSYTQEQLEKAAKAHKLMESSTHMGKIVLTVSN